MLNVYPNSLYSDTGVETGTEIYQMLTVQF